MKVELLVTIRGNNDTWPAGTVFDGDQLPSDIQEEMRLDRGTLKIHKDLEKPAAKAPPPLPVVEKLKLDETLEKMEEVKEKVAPELKIEEKPAVPEKKVAPKKRVSPKKPKPSPKKKLKVPID